MKKSKWLLGDDPTPLESRTEELRAELGQRKPQDLAARTGAIYTPEEDGGTFRLAFWGRDVLLGFPDFVAREADPDEPLNPFDQALLVHYFHHSNGVPQRNEWISFTELPDGTFYAQAFQGYTGKKLFLAFGNRVEEFSNAAERTGGSREFFASVSYSYQVLPRVALMVACWVGDEDFPSSYRILFDAAAGHHLSTDGCAILGSQLTRRLLKAKHEQMKDV